MKTIVDRRKWLRGIYADGGQKSFLLNNQGMMCCLGFRAKVRGLKDEDIRELGEPSSLYNVGNIEPDQIEKDSWLVFKDEDIEGLFCSSTEAAYAMRINDDESLTDEEREKEIIEIFNHNGEEIEFVGPRLPIVDGKEVRYEDAPEVVDENNC